MAFNSATFVVFFFVFYFAHAAVLAAGAPRTVRLTLIILSSALFYAAWDYRFVPLLFASIAIDFFLGRAIAGTTAPRRRRGYLVASVVMNLGLLAFFKYTNFFLDNLQSAASLFALDVSVPNLDIILPVGISFYTFQSLSYTIDVYRGRFRPTQSFTAFAASVSFFPQLVAGPIVRAAHLVPQMLEGPRLQWSKAQLGVLLVAVGAFKKTVADLLAPVAGEVFSGGASGLVDAWIGALAFTGQIYGDFSGYTDIAIGLAYLMGYDFPGNFQLPYFARSPSDFWRRWHISLSTWLRDYLYIPLGGNRYHLYRNLMLTMALGGLWHGAQWTFVLWGVYHGLLLVGQRFLTRTPTSPPPRALEPLRVAFMFYLTVVGWVLFRAETTTDALSLLGHMHAGTLGVEARSMLVGFLVLVALVVPHLIDAFILRYRERIHPVVIWVGAYLALVFSLVMGGSNYAFIYFQF